MRDAEPEGFMLGEDRGKGLADDILIFHRSLIWGRPEYKQYEHLYKNLPART